MNGEIWIEGDKFSFIRTQVKTLHTFLNTFKYECYVSYVEAQTKSQRSLKFEDLAGQLELSGHYDAGPIKIDAFECVYLSL